MRVAEARRTRRRVAARMVRSFRARGGGGGASGEVPGGVGSFLLVVMCGLLVVCGGGVFAVGAVAGVVVLKSPAANFRGPPAGLHLSAHRW